MAVVRVGSAALRAEQAVAVVHLGARQRGVPLTEIDRGVVAEVDRAPAVPAEAAERQASYRLQVQAVHRLVGDVHVVADEVAARAHGGAEQDAGDRVTDDVLAVHLVAGQAVAEADAQRDAADDAVQIDVVVVDAGLEPGQEVRREHAAERVGVGGFRPEGGVAALQHGALVGRALRDLPVVGGRDAGVLAGRQGRRVSGAEGARVLGHVAGVGHRFRRVELEDARRPDRAVEAAAEAEVRGRRPLAAALEGARVEAGGVGRVAVARVQRHVMHPRHVLHHRNPQFAVAFGHAQGVVDGHRGAAEPGHVVAELGLVGRVAERVAAHLEAQGDADAFAGPGGLEPVLGQVARGGAFHDGLGGVAARGADFVQVAERRRRDAAFLEDVVGHAAGGGAGQAGRVGRGAADEQGVLHPGDAEEARVRI